MSRPLLLDLFCGAGGCSVGYSRAGFDVVGVDIEPQPNYPFPFIQADAMTFALDGFDAVHASPPCQDHSPLSAVAGDHGTAWMLDGTRARLMAQPMPWVLENVGAADMRADFLLCGAMFGLRTYRHRRFEIDPRLPLLLAPPPHPRHRALTATKNRRQRWAEGWNVSITGDVGVYLGPEAMGINWMSGNELSQAIPPAYTEYIGRALMDSLAAAA